MTRRVSLSPLKEWEQDEKHSKIGLLTLYRMQTEVNPCPHNEFKRRNTHKNKQVKDTTHRESAQKKVVAEQMENIFSHRSVFDKRKKQSSSGRTKKLGSEGRRRADKKTLLMKEYSFGELNEEEMRQSWVKSQLYREFISCGDSHRKTEQRVGNNVLVKMVNPRSNQNRQHKGIYRNRVHTETSETGTEEQFCNKQKKNFIKRNSNYSWQLRHQLRKHKQTSIKHNDIDHYSSNLLASSLQNMPCEAINPPHVQSPWTDRLKDTIRQYLQSIERRSFSKKVTILESI